MIIIKISYHAVGKQINNLSSREHSIAQLYNTTIIIKKKPLEGRTYNNDGEKKIEVTFWLRLPPGVTRGAE